MAEKLRIAILGLSHDHVWDNLPHLLNHPQAELVAAVDSHAHLREKIRNETDCKTYVSAQDLGTREKIDAVWVFGSNAEGAAWAIWALERNLHVMLEKPMAATLQQADRMLMAADRHGLRLMVNWPYVWWSPLQSALQMAFEGKIGRIWQVKYRAAHAGPEELGCSPDFCSWLFDAQKNGGGAMIDYCGYGVNLARTLLGVPSRVTGVAGRFCKENIMVEDNALIAMTYPQGLAIAEASWTQIGDLTSYETMIYGTDGTLIVQPYEDGKVMLATKTSPLGEKVPLTDSPDHMKDPASHFLHCIASGESFYPLCQPRNCRDAQEILDAGRQSAHLGSEVSLPFHIPVI
ncbi:NADH-dependent dehydrogenase [Planctomycetales bacterium 10988]|nr:NADH-dependent dehydrogenase [Planctomycetales bacterium 10988]